MVVGNVVFYDATNTPISTVGGTASASSSNTPASSAFLGDTTCTNFWAAGAAGVSWLKMAFTGPVAVDHIGVTYGCASGRGFGYYLQLQYSDNNSTWTTLNEWDGVDSPSTTTTVFTSANALPVSPGIYWRLSFNLTSSCVGMTSLAFFTMPNAMGAITTTNYAAITTSIFGDNTAAMGAFTVSNPWGSQNDSTVTRTWTYAFPTLQTVGSIQFSNANISGCSQVNNLNVLYSLDGVTYTSANTFTPTWGGPETKTFNITGGPGGFAPQVGAFIVGP